MHSVHFLSLYNKWVDAAWVPADLYDHLLCLGNIELEEMFVTQYIRPLSMWFPPESTISLASDVLSENLIYRLQTFILQQSAV